MALTDKLTAIANAIRAKTGKTDQMTLAQMPAEIESITTGGEMNLDPAAIPDYVRSEALTAIEKIKAAQNENTITFVVITDAHHCGSQVDGWQANTNAGNLHCLMGAKIIANAVGIDFAVNNGDFSFGNSASTVENIKEQIQIIESWTEEAFGSIPKLYTIGNHDTGEYSTRVGADWLMTNIMGKSDATTFGSTTEGKPYYFDLPDRKVRVICLNTCEGCMTGADYTVSPAQIAWFAQSLQDVGSLSGWKFIVIGHYPLDLGGAKDLSNCLYQYKMGGSFSGVNFAGKNNAEFIANFHGHTHCFKVDKLSKIDYVDSAWTPTRYEAKRIANPASSFYRNNEYQTPVYGIVFGESESYIKEANTGKDTAFTVNVVDLSQKKITSVCYGAGYDREVSYAIEPQYTNQVPLSIDSSGAVYNGTGYKDNMRINSSGAESNSAGFALTGFIPCVAGDVIRLGGEGITFNEYGAMLFTYNSAKTAIQGEDYSKLGQEAYGYTAGDANSLFKWSPNASKHAGCAYIRISAKGLGANMIVTKNEVIS